MSDLFNALKIMHIVGEDEHNEILECFKITSHPLDEIEKFTETVDGLNHIMMTANKGFNLLYKHRETYKKYSSLGVDEALTGFYLIELEFEAELDQQ